MRSLPLTLRALILLPLFANGIDQARAAIYCGTAAGRCIEVVGKGWIGVLGLAALLCFCAALALMLSRMLTRRVTHPAGRWLIATAAVALLSGAQWLMAAALGSGPVLDAGWPTLLALCPVAGAVLTVTLRVAPAAVALIRSELQPHVPRPIAVVASQLQKPIAIAGVPRTVLAGAGCVRGPPA